MQMRNALLALTTAAVMLPLPAGVHAQGRGAQPPRPTPQAAAPIDLTGYWVAIVTQDWRQRMVTPPKGDYASVPINVAAKKVADAWDPARNEPAGEECKAYGAPAIMRHPTRLHITWQDSNTLKVETDAGTQTRLFHFGDWNPARTSATLQGTSVAEWVTPRAGRGGPPPVGGSLQVSTQRLRAGYLRKNGVPYSAAATMTEFWDLFSEPDGTQYIVITSQVDDPTYLREPWITALHFKKEPTGAKWNPTPCSR
jgi:hypothetical protein